MSSAFRPIETPALGDAALGRVFNADSEPPLLRPLRITPLQWLRAQNIQALDVLDSIASRESFLAATRSMPPAWPHYSAALLRKLGYGLTIETAEWLAFGVDIANALARKYADFTTSQIILPRRFAECVAALERCGR
jgi:hypothetical protein